jgi:hypothetical protein
VSSRHLTARLLSRKNRLSRTEKDVLFERVMEQLAPRRTIRRPAVLLALAGAAAAVVLVPLALRDRPMPPMPAMPAMPLMDEPFGARGGASAAGFGLICSGQPGSTCHVGEKLLFDLQGTTYRYFSAFARREDGTVVWYFPDSPTGHSVDVRDRLSQGVLDVGIALDAGHGSGRYQVVGIYSEAPLSRDDIKARFRPGATDLGPTTAIATRELVVQ